MGCDTSRVLTALQQRAAESRDPQILGSAVVEALRGEFPQAGWVGIYWLRGSELVLGPYVGRATEHIRIPVGTGICGAAVADDEDKLISDVTQVEDYLACAPGVRSELVVLIRSRGGVIGQIDLDADEVDAFSDLRSLDA